MSKWYFIACGVIFAVGMGAAGASEWRKEQRLEAVQVECLKTHPVTECKELK